MTPFEVIVLALMQAGEDPANVQAWPVKPSHPYLEVPGQTRVARAVRDTAGQEVIIYDQNYQGDLDQILQHEAAHIIAWRRHGEGIREHGREFSEICRQVVTKSPDKYCKRN